MNRILVAALVSGLLLGACDPGGGAGMALHGEGLTGDAPARLEVAGLDQPVAVEEDACITRTTVAPGGTGPGGSPRWLVTFELASAPADEAALVDAVAADACVALRRAELLRVVEGLGAVPAGSLDVTYRGPDGRRWFVG